MKFSFDAVIWDLDGVIADSGEEHLLAFQEVLPLYGIAITPKLFKEIFGMGNRETLTYLTGGALDEDLLTQIVEAKESRYRGLIHGRVKLLPGVGQWLTIFKQNGIRQAVATSAPQANVDVVMEELGISDFFEVILSAPANGLPGKPAPDVFLEAARRLQVAPNACIVFEDSPAGIEAAKKAGMVCIAVTNTSPRERLVQADRVIDSLTDLDPSWLSLLSS